jgi:two-component system, sensor histidine kinase and response regulator
MNFLVLLVEDDPIQALAQRRFLEANGFQVVTAADGMTAIEMVAKREFDAVVLDALLPDVDGVDVCRAIRGLPAGLKVPVVVLTSLTDDRAMNDFFRVGATDFISKPANQTLLRHRLIRFIQASRNEKALAESLADLERNHRVKGEFASMLAHDIRTPLTSMEMTLALLREEINGAHPILETLHSGIDRILRLSEMLLKVYEVETDIISISPEIFDVERFLHRCLLEANLLANRKAIHIIARIEPDRFFLYGDQRKLGQAIHILLVNAITATPSNGKIMLSAHSEMDSDDLNRKIVVQVTDGGKPIPVEELAFLFDPFRTGYSVEGSLEYVLGLTLARRIIDQHQGEISARQAGEKGTTFQVSLPLLQNQ